MSWFARSIANTLNFDEEDEGDDPNRTEEETAINSSSSSSSPSSPGRGVKEDISELTKTLTRQFWGVASFLAPPPPDEHQQISNSEGIEASDPEGISGIRNDLAEIGGKFRSGISNLSEITKLASNFLQLGLDEESIGVTDDVLQFVRDIATHPGTWLHFPLPEDEHDEDFNLSDAQQQHAMAVERLVPSLAALRIELCPSYISEPCFWKIYFVLLHPRLDEHDALILSTPDIMQARASLTLELKNRTSTNTENDLKNRVSSDITESSHEDRFESVSAEIETDKHQVASPDIQIVDKSVIQEEPVYQTKDIEISGDDDDNNDGDDDWLKEDTGETSGGVSSGPTTTTTTIAIENEEDVSFSDLEEDDDEDADVQPSLKKVSDSKQSNDWLDIDEIDVT
jgi:hypothetical protein